MPDSKRLSPSKRWFGINRWFFVAIIICALIGVTYYLGTNVIAIATVPHLSELRALTVHLPDVDRIEIDLVHVNFETIDRVIATKTLSDAEALKLEEIWRAQSYTYDGHVMCHAPIYRVRFYQKDELLTEATICFECHNIYFYKYAGAKESDEPLDATFSFSHDNDAYKQFRAYMSSLFPGHDAEKEATSRPQ